METESKNVAGGNENKAPEEVKPAPSELNAILLNDIGKQIALVLKSVTTKETRYLYRAIRQTLGKYRKKLNFHILFSLVEKYFEPVHSRKDFLLHLLEDSFNMMQEEKPVVQVNEFHEEGVSPEVETFITLLISLHFIDTKKIDFAVNITSSLIERMEGWNRRTLDPLSARVYFYYSRAFELAGRLSEIRQKLIAHQTTAILRHNFDGQVILLNLILRNYLHYNLYSQAEKTVRKIPFKKDYSSSNELARYFFYSGKIQIMQLSYTQAQENLQFALRKAPSNSANGFRSIVTKFLIVVHLLLGEIPERNFFRSPGIKHSLKPYLEITQVVRTGNLNAFKDVIEKHKEIFDKDKTYNLIQRLRHNVIKTALKKINFSYSRISIIDICKKLKLDTIEDAEYIIAKAIRDKIIDATINHEEGYVQSNTLTDVYSTVDPQQEFSERIKFCLQIHNDAVKSMRYHEKKEPLPQDTTSSKDHDDIKLPKDDEDLDE